MDWKLAKIERSYQRIFKHLQPAELRRRSPAWPKGRSKTINDTEKDEQLFLDFYSTEGMKLVMQKYGFVEHLEKLNCGDIQTTLGKIEDVYDMMRVTCPNSKHALIELVAQVASISPKLSELAALENRQFLCVKWVRMQNPFAEISPKRPLLPGQSFPSLGLGRQMMVLIMLMCVRLDLDAVIEIPERLHNAALYFAKFRFINPEMQGILTAILRDMRKRTLTELAWGMECKQLIHMNTRKPYIWIPQEQALPRKGPLMDWLESNEYRQRAQQAMADNHFMLNSGDLTMDLARLEGGFSCTDLDNPIPARLK